MGVSTTPASAAGQPSTRARYCFSTARAAPFTADRGSLSPAKAAASRARASGLHAQSSTPAHAHAQHSKASPNGSCPHSLRCESARSTVHRFGGVSVRAGRIVCARNKVVDQQQSNCSLKRPFSLHVLPSVMMQHDHVPSGVITHLRCLGRGGAQVSAPPGAPAAAVPAAAAATAHTAARRGHPAGPVMGRQGHLSHTWLADWKGHHCSVELRSTVNSALEAALNNSAKGSRLHITDSRAEPAGPMASPRQPRRARHCARRPDARAQAAPPRADARSAASHAPSAGGPDPARSRHSRCTGRR